jgi:signal transduction histidine kinase
VLSVTAAMLFDPKEWVLWIAAFTFISAGFFIAKHGWSDGLFSAIIYASAYYFFASFAKSTADTQRAEQQSKQLLLELQIAHQQLQAYADQVQELTIVEERNRMAREMHDTVGHRLTVSAVQLEAAQRLIPKDPARAEQMVGTVREQIGEALSELRQMVAALRAPVEEDLRLDVSLQRLAEQFRQGTGLTVELAMPVERPELPPQHRRALYRAAQESLTNVQRHAQAKRVWMRLQRRDGGIALVVSDDGVGIPPKLEVAGFGLKGLQERTAQLGGDFHLAPRPGGGTRATFFVPLPFQEEHSFPNDRRQTK